MNARAVIDVPQGWVTALVDASTIKIVEPESKAIAAPLSGKQAPKAPRASIAVAQIACSARRDPREAAFSFLESFAACVPAPFSRLDSGSIVFKDGAAGAFVTISFEVVEGRGVLQRHFFRVDGEVLTQVTGTVADWQKSKLDRDITPIAISTRAP